MVIQQFLLFSSATEIDFILSQEQAELDIGLMCEYCSIKLLNKAHTRED